MFTPTGFFRTPAPTGFDPTLGGTLSLAYHWDWTDSSTMTLTGTDVDDITDKVGSITLDSFSTVAGSGTSDATFSTDKTVFSGASAYFNPNGGVSWVPDEMMGDQDFTIVLLCTTDYSSFPGSSIIAPWHISGRQTDDANGHNNMRITQFSPGYDPYSNPICDPSGEGTDYYFAIMRFDGGWTGKKQYFQQTLAETAGNMVTFVYDYTNTDISINLNNYDLCTANEVFTLPEGATSRAGMVIGARSEGNVSGGGSIDGEWYGDMYHTLVYSTALTQTEVNDLYNAWNAFFNG